MINYLGIFLLNIGIESIIAIILRFRSMKQLLAVVAVNGITHPILTILVMFLIDGGYYHVSFIWGLEILVVLAEWQLFEFAFREKSRKYLFLAGIMNVVSYGSGFLIFA